MGGTLLKFGLVDGSGRMIFRGMSDSPDGPEGLGKVLNDAWQVISQEAGEEIAAVGLGLPGIFSLREERIIQSPHLPFLDGLDLKGILSGIFPVPVHMDNEANLAAFGEYCAGAAQGKKCAALITIGTGVGMGIILDGRIFRGSSGFAGELGHVTVNPGGEACACGGQGCLETEVSASAICRHYVSLTGTSGGTSPVEVNRRAQEGEMAALHVLEEAGRYLGIGLSIIIDLFNPDMVLLGGGILEAGSILLEPALEEARNRTFPASFEACGIQEAALGNDAGFIGAALWAQECEGG